MTNWRETGYVPDSDAEDDSDISIDAEEYQKPLSNTNKQNTPTTGSQPWLNASGSGNNLPSLKSQVPSRISYQGLGVLDLSDLPDENECEKIEEKPEKEAKSNTEHRGPQILSEPSDGEHTASQSARRQVRQNPQAVRNNLSKSPLTPTRRDLPLASSQEFSPLSDAPSNLSSPPGFWPTRQTRPTAFSIVPPPVPTSNYSAVSNSSTSPSPTTDEFTSGPLHNLRQRKPIQLNPYLIEQARYRKTLKSRGIKPIVFKSADVPEVSVRPHSEEEEYEASNDDEDESQPRRRRHADGTDLHLDEIRLAQAQVTETLQEDDWDFPDVSTILQMPIRKDGAGPQGIKRRKLVHTYGAKHPSAKPRPVWKQPMLSPDHHASRFTNTLPPNEHRPVTPPITRDPPSAALDGSSPVRPSQRRPLIQRSINTTSPVNIVSSDDNTTPRASPRHRTRAVSISSSTSSSSISRDPSNVDFRRLQKRTNGVLPASWWKLDYEKKKEQHETVAIQRRRNSVTPDRSIHQPRVGVVRAKISKKPRPAAENMLSFIDNDESKSDSSEPGIIHAAIVPKPTPTEIIYQDRDDARRWLSLDDDMIMEDDRIDLMLPKPPRKKQSSLKVIRTKRNRKDKQVASRLPGSNKDRLEDEETIHQSSKASTDPKRQARHKATGERSGRGSSSSRVPSPQLSIVDIYKYHKATTQSTPPPFLKIAQRTAKKRPNQARGGPGRKVFVLETENDTREVQAVLREWREGTLGAIAYTQTLTLQNKQTQEAGQFNEIDMEYPGRSAREPHAFPRTSSRAEPVPRQRNEKSDQSKFPAVSLPTVAFGKSRNLPVTKPRRLRQTFLKPTVIPAQVQALSGEFYYPTKVQFSRAMTPVIDILRAQRPARPTGFNHPALEKFLQDDDLVVSPLAQLRKERKQLQSVSKPSTNPSPSLRELQQTYTTKHLPQRKRIRRKNTPQRIDADVRERRQPPQENVPVDDSIPIQIDPIPVDQAPSLTGLAPYGTRYSLNFDTHALRPGTVFHSETFIGCGGLSRALSTSPAHQRGIHTRIATCNVANQTLNWGVYRDGIASEFEIIMDAIMDSIDKAHAESSPQNLDAHLLASQVYTFYQFCSNYVADILHFSDSVDVVSFGQRFLSVLRRCSKRLCTEIPNPPGRPDLALPSIKIAIYTHCFTLILAFQIQKLFSGATDAVRKSLGFESLIRDFGKTLITALLRCGIQAIRQCYEDQRFRVRFERGLGKESYIVEAWVMAIYILDQASPSINVFWKTLNFELHCDELIKVADISIYERCWKTVFTLLPLFQFDSQGVIGQHGKREHPLIENWELLKQLASSFLNHYKANGDKPTINDYCRIIYTRTHHLITKWGWINPEPMIATLFNFFARNSLPNLRNEPDRGSPLFLQQLNSQPSLAAEDLDVCFHLLLKIIAITLQSMSTSSSTKKIRDYVFRLMPNHRRHYPKEEDLRIEHLVALRNHHDLLCTLYWASPPICRPPLSAIRDLVDPGTSHRQACAVSVRAWSYLIRFQLHSDEDIVQLTPLMDWYDDISEQILAQHNSCRAEATKQFTMERERGRIDISEADFEDTIRRNQRQLEGLLQEAVRALGIAMTGMKGRIPSAMKLLTTASIGKLLSSFTKVSNKLLGEVLEVVTLYVDTCLYNPTPISQPYSLLEQASEESQDYGDWSGMEDFVLGEEKKAAGQHLLTVVYEPLLRMVSNALGADQQPADVLLLKAIDTWAKVGGYLVQQGLKTWEMYLDSYSRDSWASFRDTPQTRKFTAYYMCKLVQTYPDAYSLNKPTFISYWLRTLVERNSMLYYQHALTSALLNSDLQNPLFHNLPFAKSDANVYEISLTEFEARRLSLIGTFLANMRISYDQSASISIMSQLRAEYSSMLSYLMNSMRENYLTLQQLQQNPVKPGIANNTNSSTSTDAYVAFVQEVVSLLQQHTPDICPIDKFFTDSSVFPLPADDPTYVIGKLRNYALKLTLPRTHKQLTAFFQTLCERAAIDGEQDYLVNQLVLAMEGERESGGKTMTLRSFLMRTVFPVYVQCAFGWGSPGLMLAMPIGKAVIRVLIGIRTELDSCDFQAVQGVVYTLSGWIEGVLRAFVERFVNKDIMQGWICNGPSPMSAMLILVMESLERCLPVLDWLLVQADESSDIIDAARGDWFTEKKRIISMVTALIRVVVWIDKNIFSPPSATSLQQFYEIQGLSSIIANTTSPIYEGRGSNFINDLQLHHIQYSYLSSLCSSLTREWHSNPLNSNETTLFRNGIRRSVHSKSINAWKELFYGLDDSKRCVSFVKKVLVEFLERTARTEIWGGVVMEEARGIWEGEVGKRGRPGRMGRAKWAGVAELFC